MTECDACGADAAGAFCRRCRDRVSDAAKAFSTDSRDTTE